MRLIRDGFGNPPEYEVVDDDGTVLGRVRRKDEPMFGGTLRSWTAYLPTGERHHLNFNRRQDAADFLKGART